VRVVRAVRHVMRLVWGDDLDPALRPVLGVTLIGTAAGSAMWTFMSIWAVEELGAKAALPFALLVGAVFSALSGFAGGYLSDRIGRRRVILIGNGVMVGYPLLLFALSDAKAAWRRSGATRSATIAWPTEPPSAPKTPANASAASPAHLASDSAKRSSG
jgi:MFS family permease